MIDLTLPFSWKTHKNCKIIATGSYNRDTFCWTPKATVYWKRGTEKHLAFFDDPGNDFNNRSDAEAHAMSMAIQWCDEHIF